MWKGAHNNLQEGSFVKCASSGTVILKGESAENKSTQQSWPTFMLECFQRQQSLFSYAINCLNRLPVEFLMCYKFRVCFLRVDSTQAHCVRPCPVISTGLGRTLTKESTPLLHLALFLRSPSLLLNGLLCARLSRCCHSGIYPFHLHDTSTGFCNARFSLRSSPHPPHPIWEGRCETWRGSLSDERRCQTDYPAAGRSWTAVKGHLWFLSPQSAESVVTPGLLPVGVKPCFQSILMHNQQGFPFQLNSYTGTLHVLSSMQILLDFPRIWADFLPWIFPYKCL